MLFSFLQTAMVLYHSYRYHGLARNICDVNDAAIVPVPVQLTL
jgi:hypothetical protein